MKEKIRYPRKIRKLDTKWEGLYRVIEAIGNATYKLEKPDGKEIPRTWNVSKLNLKAYWILSPWGVSSITPVPLPCKVDDPSTKSFHHCCLCSPSPVVISTTKSTKA
ncbi:UNVERIFIED_CONTAM: hypothetical protein Sradi_0848900 [Sesamum radiatum]|uniref:Tf2-1-like SH3-like domain-containing protein n=1 Tax=Sesamum radiatum TaxID=300843 RepID=A0AAW2V1E6_SESRA